MRKLATLLLLALALPGAAQSQQEQALRARPAAWTVETIDGARVLRGATMEDPGDRLIFLCNNEHRLVATIFMLSDDARTVVDGAGEPRWVIDGAFQPAIDSIPPMVMNRHVMGLARVEPELLRQLLGAETAGFAWFHREGGRFAGFQIRMIEGRAQLAAFARACNAEAYP